MKGMIISGDWGTSNLRLRLLDVSTGEILSSMASQVGIKPMFRRWQDSGGDRTTFYLAEVGKNIQLLADQMNVSLRGCPIIMSGMASASIGMCEVAYSPLPFVLSELAPNIEFLPASPTFAHDVLVTSGLETIGDVMRGEEMQAVGWWLTYGKDSASTMLILPGTHAKHLHIWDGTVVDFKTYMTGELFQIISEHSILASDLDEKISDVDLDMVRKGARDVRRESLSHLLFSIRGHRLQNRLSKEESAAYLSGLLIGSEFAHVRDEKIALCADEKFTPMYKEVIDALGLSEQCQIMDKDEVDAFLPKAQLALFTSLSRF